MSLSNKHIPDVFQVMPVGHGLVLRVLWPMELEPDVPEEALAFVLSAQIHRWTTVSLARSLLAVAPWPLAKIRY